MMDAEFITRMREILDRGEEKKILGTTASASVATDQEKECSQTVGVQPAEEPEN